MNDRKKAEYDRLHHQEIRITGAEPSLYKESEWCLKYVKLQCDEAVRLYKGPTMAFIHVGVSKQDMFKAQELIDDAQRALDDPTTHPQLHFAWVREHKSEAYRIIKSTREGHFFARAEVDKLHVVSVQALLSDAWSLYKRLNHDSREATVKPSDVFNKLKEVQRLITDSYLKKESREDLRNKVQELWDLVREFIEETQRQYQVRQAARTQRDQEWRQRQGENIDRWQSRINNSTEFVERLEAQISDLEVKLASARTTDFAERVQGWIEEKVEKIKEARAQISELQTRINDVQQRLRESNS